jgi:hypothetical protein
MAAMTSQGAELAWTVVIGDNQSGASTTLAD